MRVLQFYYLMLLCFITCLFQGCGCVDGKWGFINTAGKEVVEFKYSEVRSFSGGLAVVFNDDGRAGLVDISGKEILSPRFSDISDFEGDYAYFVIRDDSSSRVVESYGFLNKQGKVVREGEFSYVKVIYKDVAVVKKEDSKYFLTKIEGSKIGDVYFDDITMFKDNHAIIKVDDRYGVIDYTGTVVIAPTFDEIREHKDGLFVVGKKNSSGNILYGLIDKKGEIVIKIEYSDIIGPSEGFITFKKDGLYGVMILDGKTVIEPAYELLSEVVDSCALFCKRDCSEDKKLLDYDRKKYYGEVGYVCIKEKEGEYEIGKKDLIDVYSASVFSNQRAEICKEKGKCYLVDNNFNQLTSAEYSIIREFFEGRAFACKQCNYDYGEWFLLDISGKQVNNRRFYRIMDFSEGLAAVMIKEVGLTNWSFIDLDGRVVIEGDEYNLVKSFKEGRAAVCKGLCERLGGGH